MIEALAGPHINMYSICHGDEKIRCFFSRIFVEYGEFICVVIVRVRYQTTTKRGFVM